jgi:hypothetical protein
MSNNWLKTVNRINRDRFQIPEGWDTKEQVAANLQCDPSKVADILKPGIASGDIERKEFPTWDEKRRMSVRVTCYRIAGAESSPKVSHPAVSEKILASIKRNPKHSDIAIAKNIRGATVAMVKALRK